jgi:glycosyltransferase involved in cell wall biosynthesis
MRLRYALLVAYHVPPLSGSSGVQRTLQLVRDLPALGWQPSLLTAHPRAYAQTSDAPTAQLPTGIAVNRAFALDAARHLAVAGRYPGWLARPDRYTAWLLGAVPAGLSMIGRLRPQVIWSTYPVPTAHLIGYWLSRLSGLPWVADFRDPMAHEGYPEDAATWRSYLRVEQRVARQAAAMVFTTPGAARLYSQRYTARTTDIHVVENGYDEQAFARAGAQAQAAPLREGALTLLHSGIVYPKWRNPQFLFAALRRLRQADVPGAQRLWLRLRAPVHEDWLRRLAAEEQVADRVEILPALPYDEALAEMLRADALLALQADSCAEQIPAKVYEQLRAGRPLLGLVSGDTAALLQRAGQTLLAPLEDPEAVQTALRRLLAGEGQASPAATIAAAARSARSAELAALFERYAGSPPPKLLTL